MNSYFHKLKHLIKPLVKWFFPRYGVYIDNITNKKNQLIEAIGRIVYKRYGLYAETIAINKWRRLTNPTIENKYLFILSPPFCGSTLLHKLISTSPSVSTNNSHGTREGQTLPTTRGIMFTAKRWDDSVDFNWNYIRKEWLKYWDVTKPVLLEKSPASIIRASSINKEFSNAHFIILYRNPYAHCESLIRLNGTSPKKAAKFALKCLNYQKDNLTLSIHSIAISYEQFTEGPHIFLNQLHRFIPEFTIDLSSHLLKSKIEGVNNSNDKKIKNLTKAQHREINAVFLENIELLHYFNYEIIAI